MNQPRFKVNWTTKALDVQIVEILEARFKDRIPMKPVTVAMNAIDRILETDPVNAGESRDEGARVMSIAPLTVYFKIFVEERVVQVFRALDFEHKPR